jgi:hypothetical protein
VASSFSKRDIGNFAQHFGEADDGNADLAAETFSRQPSKVAVSV